MPTWETLVTESPSVECEHVNMHEKWEYNKYSALNFIGLQKNLKTWISIMACIIWWFIRLKPFQTSESSKCISCSLCSLQF